MESFDSELMKLFEEMLKKGLISTGNLWINIAVEQKNKRLPIAIAHSMLLTFDRVDRKILSHEVFN
jgi:hypothetical protein